MKRNIMALMLGLTLTAGTGCSINVPQSSQELSPKKLEKRLEQEKNRTYDNDLSGVTDMELANLLTNSYKIKFDLTYKTLAVSTYGMPVMRKLELHGHGSGTVIHQDEQDRLYFLSCAHLTDHDNLITQWYDGQNRAFELLDTKYAGQDYSRDKPCALELLFADTDRDVSLFRTKTKHKYDGEFPILADVDKIAPGDVTKITGYPKFVGEVMTDGQIAQVEDNDTGMGEKYFITTATINPGNSGGACYVFEDGEARLAGISQFYWPAIRGLYGLVPVDEIQAAFKEHKYEGLLKHGK